jgi:hypothetical protein
MLAGNWRIRIGVSGATERRIADAIAASSRGHVLALGQCLEAALQHEGSHVPAAIPVVLRCGGSGRTKESYAGDCCDCCDSWAQKLVHVYSPCLSLSAIRCRYGTKGELWPRENLKMRPTLETLSSKSTKSTRRTLNLYFETRDQPQRSRSIIRWSRRGLLYPASTTSRRSVIPRWARREPPRVSASG